MREVPATSEAQLSFEATNMTERHSDVPEWAAKGFEAVAFTEDIVSGRRYRLWIDRTPRPRAGRLGRLREAFGTQETPFVVEQVDSGVVAASLRSWREVERWRGRTVIAPGWLRLNQPTLDDAEAEESGREPFTHRDGDGPR